LNTFTIGVRNAALTPAWRKFQNGSATVKQKSDVTCRLAPYAESSCKVGKKKVLQAVSFRA